MSFSAYILCMISLTRNGIVTPYTVECRFTSGGRAFLSGASFSICTMKGMNSSSAEPVIVESPDGDVTIVQDLAIKRKVVYGG
jgi:hypothetical protein